MNINHLLNIKMRIQGKTYTVEYIKNDNKLVFSGNLRLQSIDSYDEIIDFTLHYAHSSIEPLLLDFTRLEIINSAGIASLGLFFVRMRDTDNEKQIKILASKYIQWQFSSLRDFEDLYNNLKIEFVVHH